MRAEWFDFRPQAKLFLATNHRPVVGGQDNAIWDRVVPIPFTVRITDEEVDPGLFQKLRRELPGILAWAVQGCLEWQEMGGLNPPDAVLRAKTDYRTEMDVL